MFCKVQFIDTQANEIFGKLKSDNFLNGISRGEFVKKAAFYFSEINALHPFRDAHVIIRTKLEKPSKINGLHYFSPCFLCSEGRVVSQHF